MTRRLTTTTTEVIAVELAGCGHTIYLSDKQMTERRRDHKRFYCTYCGQTNHYPHKSDLETLQGQLASTRDMLDTVRADRDRKEMQRRAEKAAKTRIKNRIANGVCPCCRRTFADLQKHMASQHPEFVIVE